MHSLDLVVKRNEFIQAHYKLSMVAQKIVAGVLSKIDPRSKELGEYVFTAKEMSQLVGSSKSNFYKTVDDATTELQSVVIKTKSNGVVSKFNMFFRSRYYSEKGILEFKFHPDMEPFIIDFVGNFTKYQLGQIQELSSKYSIRMYELLRQHHPMKKEGRSIFTIQVENLHGILGVVGKSYSRFNNFRLHILETARKDIIENTDIGFTYESVRNGRSIVALKFRIETNHKNALSKDAEGSKPIIEHGISSDVIDMLNGCIPNFPVSALPLLGKFSDKVIQDSLLKYLAKSSTIKIENPVSYFVAIVQKIGEKEEAENANHQLRSPKTTQEKLTDRTWADGLQFDEPQD